MATVCSLFVFNSRPNHKETCWPFRVIKNRFFFSKFNSMFLRIRKNLFKHKRIPPTPISFHFIVHLHFNIGSGFTSSCICKMYNSNSNLIIDKVLVIISNKTILNFFNPVFFSLFILCFCSFHGFFSLEITNLREIHNICVMKK